MKMLVLFLFPYLLISSKIHATTAPQPNETTPSKYMIELVSDADGLFSNLARVLEWIYCVKNNEGFSLYVNMNNSYGYSGNLFPLFFKPFDDPDITINPPRQVNQVISAFPQACSLFKKYPTDGMRGLKIARYVYTSPDLYTNPDFSLFRARLHPIILKYFQPREVLQQHIDLIEQKMNAPKANSNVAQKPLTKIGVHVRYLGHHKLPYNTALQQAELDQYLNAIENDIDTLMQSRDPTTTRIFLATLLEPLVTRLSEKYDVVVHNTVRDSSMRRDWRSFACTPQDARDVLIDTWCLANCDEVWCGTSNMITFAGCLNPNLKIHLLPTLATRPGL